MKIKLSVSNSNPVAKGQKGSKQNSRDISDFIIKSISNWKEETFQIIFVVQPRTTHLLVIYIISHLLAPLKQAQVPKTESPAYQLKHVYISFIILCTFLDG